MGRGIKRFVTEQMMEAAAVANAAGVGLEVITAIYGCGKTSLRNALIRAGYPGRYIGRVLSVPESKRAAALHKPALLAASQGEDALAPRAAQARSFRPVSPDIGIRAYTRPDGISVPYVPSIHDGGRV